MAREHRELNYFSLPSHSFAIRSKHNQTEWEPLAWGCVWRSIRPNLTRDKDSRADTKKPAQLTRHRSTDLSLARQNCRQVALRNNAR